MSKVSPSFTRNVMSAIMLLVRPAAFRAAEHRHNALLNAQDAIARPEAAARVRRAFWGSAFTVAFAVAVGVLWVVLVEDAGYALIPAWQQRLQVLGAGVLLWGTAFVRGWDIQTYGGETLPERANRTLYLLLSFSGTVVGVFATLCPVLPGH